LELGPVLTPVQLVIFASFKQNNRKEDNEGQRSQESRKLRKEGIRKREEEKKNKTEKYGAHSFFSTYSPRSLSCFFVLPSEFRGIELSHPLCPACALTFFFSFADFPLCLSFISPPTSSSPPGVPQCMC